LTRDEQKLRFKDLRAAALTYLMAECGATEKQARHFLETNLLTYGKNTASRDWKLARSKGWVQFAEDQFTAEQMSEIRTLIQSREALRKELHKRSAGILCTLQVFWSSPEAEWPERLAHFGFRIAPMVLGLLSRRAIRTAGVSWGHTMAEVINGLRTFVGGHGWPHGDQILFVPTAGEPLGRWRPEYSSSVLTAELVAISGSTAGTVSLRGVPAVIPMDFKGERLEIAREFLQHLSGYRRVFGSADADGNSEPPLISDVDTLITSVGSFEQGWTEYRDELISVGGISQEKLREVSGGDIGGALLPLWDPTAAQREEFRNISERWTGLTVDHCRRIAEAAAGHPEGGPAGVVVAAAGDNKARVLLDAVDRGLVNHALIDQTLADELAKILSVKEEEPDWERYDEN
jgi:DNA-binding transcriptional regulator LsrR (DeoR family)